MEFTDYDPRLASYAVVHDDRGRILLARLSSPGRLPPELWTLPGGGVELDETPEQGVVREVEEESGYPVTLDALVGVDATVVAPADRRWVTDRPMKAVRVLFAAHVVGGALTHEAEGTTDEARWVNPDELPRMSVVPLVATAVQLGRPRDLTGQTSVVRRKSTVRDQANFACSAS